MTAPDRGKAIHVRQRAVGIAGDIQQRKIVVDERPGQQSERAGGKDKLTRRSGGPHGHQRSLPAMGTDEGKDGLADGQTQRQDQAQLAEFRNHPGYFLGRQKSRTALSSEL